MALLLAFLLFRRRLGGFRGMIVVMIMVLVIMIYSAILIVALLVLIFIGAIKDVWVNLGTVIKTERIKVRRST